MAKQQNPTKEQIEAQDEMTRAANDLADNLPAETGSLLPEVPEELSSLSWELQDTGDYKFWQFSEDGQEFTGFYMGKEDDKLEGFKFVTTSEDLVNKEGEPIEPGEMVLLPNYYALDKYFGPLEPSREFIYKIIRTREDKLDKGRTLIRLQILRAKNPGYKG